MKRKKVDSSMAASVGYDPKKNILEIEFRSGEIWQYFDVPPVAYRELMSGSIGRYFQYHIKGMYEEDRIR